MRRTPWICLGLAALAVNFIALAGWRYKVYMVGPEEAFLDHEPTPLLAEYHELEAKSTDLEARWRADDPTVEWHHFRDVQEAQIDLYPDLVADHNTRWVAAQDVEARVFLTSGLIGTVLALVAGIWFLIYRAERGRSNSSTRRR